MKHIKKQVNYTFYMQIQPHDLPELKSTFPEFSIVSKRYIFLTRQFYRRW